MLDTVFILIFGVAVVLYCVGFNYEKPELNFIVALIFIFLGFSLFGTGYQSSNTTLGTYNITDTNVTFTPLTLVGSPTQTTDPNFDLGITLLSSVLVLFGFGMIIGRDRLLG